jgi:hypothetical protein
MKSPGRPALQAAGLNWAAKRYSCLLTKAPRNEKRRVERGLGHEFRRCAAGRCTCHQSALAAQILAASFERRPRPTWATIESENLTRLSDDLSFLDVIGGETKPRFKIRFHGSTIARVYGSRDCSGRYLDDVIPAAKHVTGLAPYHQALKTACPVYTINDVTDRNGLLVHFERLLLPFSNDGHTIDRILASFEFICADGAFQRDDILNNQTVPPALRLSATIEAAVA